MQKGTITIQIENVSLTETERIRFIIHMLISQGAFHVRNGEVIMSFDPNGALKNIDFNIRRWRASKESYPLDTIALGNDNVNNNLNISPKLEPQAEATQP